jgi:hypothetical protein
MSLPEDRLDGSRHSNGETGGQAFVYVPQATGMKNGGLPTASRVI